MLHLALVLPTIEKVAELCIPTCFFLLFIFHAKSSSTNNYLKFFYSFEKNCLEFFDFLSNFELIR